MRENDKNVLMLQFKWILKYYLKVQASHVHHLFYPAILLVICMCIASPTALSNTQWDHTSMLHSLESQSLCRQEAVPLAVGIHHIWCIQCPHHAPPWWELSCALQILLSRGKGSKCFFSALQTFCRHTWICFYFFKISIIGKLHFWKLHGILIDFYLKATTAIHEILTHLTKILALTYFILNVILQS